MISQVAVAHHRANAHTRIGDFNLGQREMINIHEPGRGLHSELHVVHEIGSAGQELSLGLTTHLLDGRGRLLGSNAGEQLHDDPFRCLARL
jgi:hypothetical protein